MIRKLAAALVLVGASALIPGPAVALQTLIPSPYPSEVTGAAPLNPEPAYPGPQRIIRDPYPQNTGEFSQGNPPIALPYYYSPRRGVYQRRVPSIYKRKYRVERHGR